MAKKLPRKIGRAVIRPHKGEYIELDFGRLGGRRHRRYCSTATEAVETAKRITREIREHGQLALALSSSQRFEAVKVFGMLKGSGVSLTSAVEQFLERHPAGHQDKTVERVAEEMLAKKATGNLRERYLKDLRGKLAFFARYYPNRPVASITTEEIDAMLSKQAWVPISKRTYAQGLNVLFNFAKRRGYCSINPCEMLELPEVDDKEPEILTIAQARKLLIACLAPAMAACLPYVAIGMFAGIRPTEMERLDWHEVSVSERVITVLGANAKGRERRCVDMSANLAAWLEPIAKASGSVLDQPLYVLRALCKDALGLDRWPHDVLRHSYGSYHYAHGRDEADTQFQMGHHDRRIFFVHYKAMVTPSAAAEFWGITPPVNGSLEAECGDEPAHDVEACA